MSIPILTSHLAHKNKFNSTIDFNKGFTLAEISIVLMIIGLLVSGILVGQDMIRAAEMRSIITEKDEVQTAVMLFTNKYSELPGDLSNATDFWGTMPTGTCSNTVAGASGGTGTQTCNGNGDGLIISNTALNSNSNSEFVLFWQHLSNAKMIKGTYSGIWTNWADTKTYYSSKMMTAYWYVDNITALPSDLIWFEGNYGNSLLHRGPADMSANTSFVLTPMEAWNIDKKIDDGLPGVGKVNILERDGANCNTLAASATTPAASYSYNLGYKGTACSLNFKNMF